MLRALRKQQISDKMEGSLQKELENAKKRLQISQSQNQVLKQENDLLKNSLVSYKATITSLYSKNKRPQTSSGPASEQQLRTVLEF